MRPLDPAILGKLYRQHAPALRLYARQWGDASEDFVQDAFVRLAQESPPPERVLPWLYRVVRNQALASRRSSVRRRRREETASGKEVWFGVVDDHLDAKEASRMLEKLPLEVREIIIARLWSGLTFEDAAQLAGCSLATAHRRYLAGLAELRERLEGQWTRFPPAPTAT